MYKIVKNLPGAQDASASGAPALVSQPLSPSSLSSPFWGLLTHRGGSGVW